MKKIALFLILLSLPIIVFAQKDAQSNKIIFGDFSYGIGASFVEDSEDLAAYIGASFNYQHDHHLYIFRYNLVNELFGDTPSGERSRFSRIHEFAGLYGYRWLYAGSSISLAGGISLNHYVRKLKIGSFDEISNHLGFPIQATVRFFKKRKRPFRAYFGLIPIGKPTTFGRSIGFKFSANFSKRGFFMFGFTYGLGVHKYY